MPDLADKTYYQLLGVTPDATTEEIKEAYKNIARAYHPDSNFYSEILGEEAKATDADSDVFKKITEAYNTLINAERRKEYDDLFPKGLRDWDDIEVNVPQTDKNRAGFGTTNNLYRPRGQTGAFRRSQFGIVDENEKRESALDQAVKGGPITPISVQPQRSIVPLFIALLFFGFIAGGILAYFFSAFGR